MSGRWRIWLSEPAREQILAAAHEHHPNEIGGVLIGVETQRRPWVTQAVAVPSRRATPVYYEIRAGARRRAVRRSRRDDPRLGYLGDWHSHPADIGPSGKDRETMADLAADRDSGCPRPVLLLARRRGEGYRLDARQQVGSKLRESRLIIAGPLAPDGGLRPPRGRKRRL